MEALNQYNQLTDLERVKIESEIETDLIDHLYKSCPAGIASAFFTGLVLTYFYYYHQPFSTLLIWLIRFNSLIIIAIILYFSYRKFPKKLSIQQWGFALCFLLTLYALSYGTCVFYVSAEPLKQFMSIGIL